MEKDSKKNQKVGSSDTFVSHRPVEKCTSPMPMSMFRSETHVKTPAAAQSTV